MIPPVGLLPGRISIQSPARFSLLLRIPLPHTSVRSDEGGADNSDVGQDKQLSFLFCGQAYRTRFDKNPRDGKYSIALPSDYLFLAIPASIVCGLWQVQERPVTIAHVMSCARKKSVECQ